MIRNPGKTGKNRDYDWNTPFKKLVCEWEFLAKSDYDTLTVREKGSSTYNHQPTGRFSKILTVLVP